MSRRPRAGGHASDKNFGHAVPPRRRRSTSRRVPWHKGPVTRREARSRRRSGGAGRRVAPALAALLCLTSACSDAPSPGARATVVPFGLAAVTDLASIAELKPPGVSVAQISSYDRTGGNADLGLGPESSQLLAAFGAPPTLLDNSYLYRDGDRYVIFDERGPGVVARIWMTGLDDLFLGALEGDIAFEVDDEPLPRYVVPRADLFSGTTPPFLAPLAGDSSVSSGGSYSVLPLTFARHLRITTQYAPHWLQITWAHLPPDMDVASFSPAEDVSGTVATLAAAGSDPKGIAADLDETTDLALAPGTSAVVWRHDGPGTVLSLELEAPAAGDADIPTGLALEATWDGAAEPQVAAPLDDLFGASLGPGARSLAFGRDGARYYFYFPMPFRSSARIALRNDGATPLDGWSLRVESLARVLGTHPGYFHATARSAHLEPDGRDYVLLDRAGSGHVVGVVMTAGCGARGECTLPSIPNLDGAHLEGDERVQIDGSRWPQIHGTGFEDFFNGGFYFVRGPFTLPTHGNPAQVPGTSPRRPGVNLRSAYRLFLADAIPFRSGIRFAIEHGPADDVPADMSSVVFYYAVPEATIAESDAILTGSADSEAAHGLVAEDRVDATLTSATRGDDSDAPFTLSGFAASVTRFRIATRPDNAGVRLRRFADIGAGRQTAVVRVDGREVGVWSSADVNPVLRWAVFDYELPASATRGRSSLDVEIDARGSPTPFTAYGYQVWCHLPPPA